MNQHDRHDHQVDHKRPDSRWRGPALKGAGLALLAATLFGISTPLVQHFGAGLGAFSTAALLYGGAAALGALVRRPVEQEAALRRADAGRLALMAAFGAVIGPVALAWGLQRTSGTSASLMLTLEALFTALLARLLYHEALDRRVATAMALLLGGGVLLIVDQGLLLQEGGASRVGLMGLLSVLAATAAWGADNTVSRALAERDPGQVVLVKAALGALATSALAVMLGEARPSPAAALGLLTVGATGYGLSLRFYLLAQRAVGAARTGSVFAFAPFIGAALAVALGDRAAGTWMWAGGLLMLAGILLHLAESHGHEHVHEAIEHEHAHRHDDGPHDQDHDHHHAHDPVHDHRHDVMPVGSHSHRHRHAPMQHAHAHVPDAHHTHPH
jgi:drug/metabolite transporter (DMT)-like permease